MGDSGFREALEQGHTFPGPFLFKIIGKPEDQFVERVVSRVRQELELDEEPDFQTKSTPAGRHVSITMEPRVRSADDVVSLYAALRDMPGVVFLL